ncbi:MAG: DUF3160 domain-containing protein [Syntrophomonadaceae bacterium]|nr:DUF3160 domain-containing protein [Syntrophomonadaceae bacterium]
MKHSPVNRQLLCGLLILMMLMMAGCNSGSIGGLDPDSSSIALAQEFAPYKKIPVQDTAKVKPYHVAPDLSNVFNAERFNFSDNARESLAKNGFVVIPAMGHEFFMTYEINRYDSVPNFITTDAVVHNYHLFYSHLLQNVEQQALIPELKKLNLILLKQAEKDYQELKGTEWENAARRNLAFFTVGSVLLSPDTKVPSAVKAEVNKEISLIKNHNSLELSPVMTMGTKPDVIEGLKEDYTQYIPRGHYAKTDELKQYFQSMMWYGRITFRLKDADETRSAILMTLALQNGVGTWEWEKIYSTTSFMVGKSDDIGYNQYAELLKQAYGNNLTAKKIATDNNGFDKFRQLAKDLEPPVINSIPIFDASIQPNRDKEIAGFRFMGQRYTLDAEIFQHLIYREVLENPAGERRMLPSGLDVPAAMGSGTAETILKEQGAFEFKNYAANMSKMQNYIARLTDEWHQNLYWSWLYTLLPLTIDKPAGYPSFMLNEAWKHKELATFLGSWAELKHDTILYTKQNYAEMGGGGMDEIDDRGYVEPNPHLYARLASLTAMTRDGLKMRGLIDQKDIQNMDQLFELVLQLKVISEKELAEEPLTEEEYELIRTFGGQLEHFWFEVHRGDGLQSRSQISDFPAMLIADVATNPPAEVLEVGTGYVDNIYVVVPIDGTLRIAKGGVYSYYEFPWAATDRLTDRKWQEMIYSDKAPALPQWTTNYRIKGTASINIPQEF